jgi:hypothetical protein
MERATHTDWQLNLIRPENVDLAWRDGACRLKEACDTIHECSVDILKYRLLRGELLLYSVISPNETIDGWFVTEVLVYPEFRALNIYAAVGGNHIFDEKILPQLKALAKIGGCTKLQIQCAPQIGKIFEERFNIKPVTKTYRMET